MRNIPLLLVVVMAVAPAARAQPAAGQDAAPMTLAMYAPTAAFADSSARLAYVQGLARAIQQRTGVPVTGKAFVRLSDLLASKPDLAIIDGQCLATRNPGTLVATAVMGGDVAQAWGLYTRSGEKPASLQALRGKKLVYVRTGCRDVDFLDNAMLGGEVRTQAFFGALVDKPDVAGAVLTVRDYRAADAVFAPALQARGLVKAYDAGTVPNPGLVILRPVAQPFVEQVRAAVLGYGSGGGIEGWRAGVPTGYSAMAQRMSRREKRLVLAAPEVVRLDDSDVLVLPASRWEQAATVRHHFWEPAPGGGRGGE
jgi:hypothetical protein